MAPKPPAARGFTKHEVNALRFEGVTLYLVLMVAIIAAVISFQALTDAGRSMNLRWAALLLPLAIDGFAIACSVGIIRSQAAGERGTKRASEWLGLCYALGVSILGNVYHVLGDGYPDWLKVVMAASIPVIVAYGLHVYGRAMSTGISRFVMADDPTKVHFDLVHLDDQSHPASAPAPRKAPAKPAPRATAAPRPVAPASAPQVTGAPASNEAQECARALYDDMRGPGDKPDSARIHEAIQGLSGAPGNKATTRKWIARWWAVDPYNPDAELHAADPEPVDPILAAARLVEPEDDSRGVRAVG
jgi:hypothetical protein